jgi:phosphomevalonate kinase
MAANLQIQIDPPTQGAQQTERDFQRVAAAATAAHKAVQSGSGASQSALVGVHGTAIKTAGGFDALQAAVSRNASAAPHDRPARRRRGADGEQG